MSYNGGAYIRVAFNHEADMTLALDGIKDRVGQIRNLPVDMEPLVISRLIDMEDIAIVLVKGPGDISELIPVVQQMERELISRGIDRIEYEGFPEEEIAIQVSSARLHELNTSLDTIAVEVNRRSTNTPAGTVGRGQGSRLLRSLDQKRNTTGFEQLEISLRSDGRLTQLGDIATITKRPKDGQVSLSREGDVAIEMHLYRSADSDAILSAEILNEWLEEIRPTLSSGVEVLVYAEVWMFLKDQLNLILENGTSGLLLVIFILFVFLNGRAGFWVMIGIPVSFLFATLLYFWLFAGSINILALITFVMALGIVVGEDAVTRFESGLTATEAAIAGARRMFVPVVTSSLTTMAAFVPLLLVGGEMGDIILTVPAVLLCVILASLIECFLVLPGHLKSSFQRNDLASLKQFPVKTPTGELVALGAVANLYNRRGIDVINHKNNELSITVSAHVDTDVNNTDQIIGHLQDNTLKDILDRYGLKFDLTGASKRSEQMLKTMARGAVLTLIFETYSLAIYMVPVAVTICFGLAFSTLLVLLVVPALIVLIEAARENVSARFAAMSTSNLNTGV